MDISGFKATLSANTPPAEFDVCLQALWHDAHGDWNAAHRLVDSLEQEDAYHVHAYLHRKEGDQGNASYWYRRAGKPKPSYPLQHEWEEITILLLGKTAR